MERPPEKPVLHCLDSRLQPPGLGDSTFLLLRSLLHCTAMPVLVSGVGCCCYQELQLWQWLWHWVLGRGWVSVGSWISVDCLEKIMVGRVHTHTMAHLVRPKVEMRNSLWDTWRKGGLCRKWQGSWLSAVPESAEGGTRKQSTSMCSWEDL